MMKKTVHFLTLSFCFCSMIACAQTSRPDASASPKLDTEDQKALYALGILLGKNIKPFALKPEELAIVKAGLTDAVTDRKPQIEIETYGPKVNELAQKRAAAGADDAKKKGQEFVEKVSKEKDATRTLSGIVIRTITAGTRGRPTAAEPAKSDSEGQLIRCTSFAPSINTSPPAPIALDSVVPA